MSTSTDIWVAFARTFSMLFLVLALLIFAFYLIKKVSTAKGGKGSKEFIKILSVHHLSPKEKLVLVNIPGQTLLIGVTPAQISKISRLETDIEVSRSGKDTPFKFSDFLSQKLGNSDKKNDLIQKGTRS